MLGTSTSPAPAVKIARTAVPLWFQHSKVTRSHAPAARTVSALALLSVSMCKSGRARHTARLHLSACYAAQDTQTAFPVCTPEEAMTTHRLEFGYYPIPL